MTLLPVERYVMAVQSLLSIRREGMTQAELCKSIAADFGAAYDRALVLSAIDLLSSQSKIDSEPRPGARTQRRFFIAGRGAGARVRIVDAASVPLPPMARSTWFSALGVVDRPSDTACA